EAFLHYAIDVGGPLNDGNSAKMAEKAEIIAHYTDYLICLYEQTHLYSWLIQALISGVASRLLVPPDCLSTKALLFNNLGIAHEHNYQRAGDPSELENAIQASEEAVNLIDIAPVTHTRTITYKQKIGRASCRENQ